MSADIFDRRLNGVAIYNPDLLSKDELVEQFIARQDLLGHFVADLHRPGFKQHQVIIGTRGMGKTTLLRRLRYAVEDDPKLDAVWMPVTFPEEQYNVARLSDLYLNFIDALGDALEHRGRREEADALDEAREGLPRGDESRRAQAALELLLETATRLDRRLLLLVDNLDLVLKRLAKQPGEQWAFREMLSQKHAILLIGAMPVVIGATYDYDAPFYDFFQIHELGGLTRDETRRVLMSMAEQQAVSAVQTILETDSARIDTLHTLTAGNPRTIALLFSVLAQGTDGDVRTDLEKLLDQCTPLYKSRFEALPAGAQHVVDAIAIHWDPISAGELAEKLSIDVNTVSAQLNRLVQQGVIEKVEYDPSTKAGFQIAERFFNIWYLMRASRRVRRRLIWLVHFLRLFYGAAELKERVKSVLRSAGISPTQKLRHAEICLALAEVVHEDKKTRYALESSAIRALVSEAALSQQLTAMLDLDGADAVLRIVVDRERWLQQFNNAVDALAVSEIEKQQINEYVRGARLTRAERLTVVERWPLLKRDASKKLLQSFRSSRERLATILGHEFSSLVVRALQDGYMDTLGDEEGASTAAIAFDAPALEALFTTNHADRLERLQRISRTTDDPFVKVALADVLSQTEDNLAALKLIEEARTQEAFLVADALYARVLAKVGRSDEAVRYMSSALELMPGFAEGWRILGEQLACLGRTPESLDAYQKSLDIERDPETLTSMGQDLLLMQRFDEAIPLLREARLSRDGSIYTTLYLAICLIQLKRSSEARELLESTPPRPDVSGLELIVYALTFFALEEGARAMEIMQPVLPKLLQSKGPELGLFIEALQFVALQGYASAITDVMEKYGFNETMQPLYVALRIADGERREILKRMAPETRVATEAILNDWDLPPIKKKATKKTATRRKKST